MELNGIRRPSLTGGASGLRRVRRREALAAQGARVAVVDLNARLAAEADGRRASGGVAVDLRRRARCRRRRGRHRAARTKAHGPACVLVNCAGVGAAEARRRPRRPAGARRPIEQGHHAST